MSRLLSEHCLIKKAVSFAIITLIVIGAIGLTSSSANAETMAYELVSYDLETTVFDDHSYKVRESITINLPEDTLTLDVALPYGNYQVTDVKVKGSQSQVSTSGSRRTLTISDAKKLTKGKHTFDITYRINEYAERNSEYDIFYYNALLPDWKVPIGALSIKVTFPADFPWSDIQYYAGQFGVSSDTTKLNYKADEASRTVTITGSKIPENYSITLKAQLPDGYWEKPLDHAWAGYMIAGILFAVLVLCFLLWLIGGRDPKVDRTREAHPIEGVLPSDITYIYEGKVKIRDIIALIIYMGTKGYLKISEYAPRNYAFYKLNEPKNEERFIRTVYNTIFEDVYENRSIDVSELGPRLRRALKHATLDIEAGYADKSMASKTLISRIFRGVCIALIALSIALIPVLTSIYQYISASLTQPLIFGALAAAGLVGICRRFDSKYDVDDRHYAIGMAIPLLAYAIAVGLPCYYFIEASRLYIVGAIAVLAAAGGAFFVVIMPARGRGNAELAMRLNQLRKFIYRSKWTDVEEMYRHNPEYYYEMFPYALVFSGLESWAKKFIYLDVGAPKWYSDDIEGHAESSLRKAPTPLDYARDINSFARTMEDSYNAMMLRRRGHRRNK